MNCDGDLAEHPSFGGLEYWLQNAQRVVKANGGEVWPDKSAFCPICIDVVDLVIEGVRDLLIRIYGSFKQDHWQFSLDSVICTAKQLRKLGMMQ